MFITFIVSTLVLSCLLILRFSSAVFTGFEMLKFSDFVIFLIFVKLISSVYFLSNWFKAASTCETIYYADVGFGIITNLKPLLSGASSYCVNFQDVVFYIIQRSSFFASFSVSVFFCVFAKMLKILYIPMILDAFCC